MTDVTTPGADARPQHIDAYPERAGGQYYGAIPAADLAGIDLSPLISKYSLDDLYPLIDPGERPLCDRVLIQYQRVPAKTRGGILRPDDVRDIDQRVTAIAVVRAIGPQAFTDWTTGEVWGGADGKPWYGVGSFIRVPIYGGMRFYVPDDSGPVPFGYIQEKDPIALVSIEKALEVR